MKSWADVAASPEFQALSGVEQDKARGQYFDQVVAPRVPAERVGEVRQQFDADTRIAKKDLLPWIAPSDAGAGRGVQGGPGGLELASAEPPPRRGGTRAEASPFVGGDAQAVTPAAAPPAQSALDRPDANTGPGLSDFEMSQGSTAPWKLDQQRQQSMAAAQRTGVANRDTQAVKDTRAGVYEGTGLDNIAGKFSVSGAKGMFQAIELGANALRLLPEPGAGSGLRDKLGDVATWARMSGDLAQAAKDQDSRAQWAQMQQILQDPNANIATVMGFLMTNPGITAEMTVESAGVMVPAITAGKLSASLAERLSERVLSGQTLTAGTARRIEEISRSAAGTGAAAANIGMGAGGAFDQAKQKGATDAEAYTAAGLTGLGYWIAHRATGGGAETALAKGGSMSTLGTAAKEGAQESIESLSESVGAASTPQGQFDAGSALKQAALEGSVGAVAGGAIGAMGAERPANQQIAGVINQNADLWEKFFRRDKVVSAAPSAPSAARAASITRFDELAAAFGLDPAAAAKVREQAGVLPTPEVPGFLARVTGALNKRGLFRRPVDDAGVQALDDTMNTVEAPPEAKGSNPDAKPTGQGTATLSQATGQGTANPGAENGQGTQDYTGLSEPSPAPAGVSVAGEPINRNWTAFAPESGTLSIPREQMPQIDAAHRGALVNFLNARGIEHQSEEVEADTLKPTQAEFSPKKVQGAADFQGGDRSILVSADNYILDGTHQWLAKREAGAPVKIIRLQAPIQDLLRLAHQFPSSTTSGGATRGTNTEKPNEPLGNLDANAGALVATPAGRGTDAGGSGGTVGPAAAAPGPVDRPAAAPETSAQAPTTVADAGKSDKALIPAGLKVTFGGKTYPVDSINDAQDKWIAFRDSADGGFAAGVSQVGNGIRVTDGAGRFVARISYNGRAWDGEGEGAKVIAEATDGRQMPKAITDDEAKGIVRVGTSERWLPPVETFEQAQDRSKQLVEDEKRTVEAPALKARVDAKRKSKAPEAAAPATPPGQVIDIRGELELRAAAKAMAKAERDEVLHNLNEVRTYLQTGAISDADAQTVVAELQKVADGEDFDAAMEVVDPILTAAGKKHGGRMEAAANEAPAQPATQAAPEAKPSAPRKPPKASSGVQTVWGSRLLGSIFREMGGLAPELLHELSFKKATGKFTKGGKPVTAWFNPPISGNIKGGLFREGGIGDTNEIAQWMEGAGYITPGTYERNYQEADEAARSFITAALNKDEPLTDDERIAQAQADDEANMQAWIEEQKAAQIEAADDLTPDDLQEIGYEKASTEVQELTAALMAELEQLGVDTENMRDDAARATSDLTEDEYHAELQKLARQAIADARKDAAADEAQGPGRGNQIGGGADGAQGAEPGSEEVAPAFDLEAQTAEDLKAKTERESAALEAERAKKAADQARLKAEADARDIKARADQTVDDFQLGVPASRQMSGITDMFSEPPAPPAPPSGDLVGRAKYKDGRSVPIEGDEVYTFASGFGGMAASVQGTVRAGKNGLFVAITGSHGMLGETTSQKRTDLTGDWTLKGEEHPNSIRRRLADEKIKAESAAIKATYEAERTAAAERNGTLDKTKAKLGDVIEDPKGALVVVAEIDEKGGLYVRQLAEGEEAGRGIGGDMRGYKLRPDVKLPADGTQLVRDNGMDRKLFADGWQTVKWNDDTERYERVDAKPAAESPATRTESTDSEEVRRAKADLVAGLGNLAAILSKGTRANITPEQEQALLPVLTSIFDASFRLGKLKFKEAAKFVLDQIRSVIGDDAANLITLDHLQGAYIGMAGKYRDRGAEKASAVAAVESLEDIAGPAVKTESNPADGVTRAVAGGQEGKNGEWYPGGSFLPSTDAPKGTFTVDKPATDTSVTVTPTGTLAGAGLTVEEKTSQKGKTYWSVTGNTREHEAVLDALGFGKVFKMGGKWYRSVHDADPTERLASALQGNMPEPAPELPSLPAEEAAAVLRQFKVSVEQQGDAWVVMGKSFDIKDTIKATGGRWNGQAWAYTKDPTGTLAAALKERGSAGDSGNDAGAGESDAEIARRRELRQREDARPDERADAGNAAELVDQGTQDLILRGEKFGIPLKVLRDQIEDVGLIVNAHAKGKPLFLLANEAGTGKTLVLGGAIRELRARGESKFVYVTMNTDLIAQIKKDLADYGVDDVSFHTYSELSGKGFDTEGAVLIFDEAHNVKNVGAETARANKAQDLMAQAKMTLLASATLFENPVEARYLASTGIFDSVGGFGEWAKTYGASVKVRKFYNPNTGRQETEEIIYWAGRGKKEDGAAARQWLFKQAIMTQRAMMIDPGMVDVQFRRNAVDASWVDLYQTVADAYDAAEDAWKDENGNPRDAKIVAEVARHRENTIKRVLEASKVKFAITEAKALLAAGRNVVIFVETKADRHLGRWKRSEHFKDDTLYTYEQMQEMLAEWKMEERMARMQNEKAPPRPFAEFIVEIARFFDAAGIDSELPSTADQIVAALGEQNVAMYTGAVSNTAAAKNKADFMAGRKTVLVATIAKGGTGLSLHDTKGDRPTTQLNLNLPWKATGVDQVSARVARYGLRSKAEVRWLFASNIPWEANKLAPRVGARMRDMGAIVKGIEVKAAEILDGKFDFEGDIDAKGGSAISATVETGDIYARAKRMEALRRKADDTSNGFFETPYPLAALMANVSGVRAGHRLLEPSGGRGNLLRLLPDGVNVTAVELRQDNREALTRLKPDAVVIPGDFMEWTGGKFDTVLMNPPFERVAGVGAQDVAHVMRAFDMLDDGGRLVAIMGEGAFFRDFKQEQAFRQWLEDVGATVIQMPEGAFKQSGTGVRTRMVVIDKDGEAGRTDLNLHDMEIDALRAVERQAPSRTAVAAAEAALPETTVPAEPVSQAEIEAVAPPAVKDMELFIRVAADSIEELRKTDVYRVLVESNRSEHRNDIADFIRAKRPDLRAEVDAVMAEASIEAKAAPTAPAIPAGYKPAGEPYYKDGVLTQGYAKFAPGERVRDTESRFVGTVDGPMGQGPVFDKHIVKFDNGTMMTVPGSRLEAAPADAAQSAPTMSGPRRDPAVANPLQSPYNNGDIVAIGGKDWMVKQDTPGWYLTSDGTWRGMHPTINGIRGMIDLIREVDRAAQWAMPQTSEEDPPQFTEAQARKQFEWRDLGQKNGVKTHMLFWYEKPADKGTGSAMGRVQVTRYEGSSGWQIDGEGQKYPGLADAKAAAIEVGMRMNREQGWIVPSIAKPDAAAVVQEAETLPQPKPEAATIDAAEESDAQEAAAAEKIANFGQKIGGSRADTAKPLGKRMTKEKDDRPGWARKYHAMPMAGTTVSLSAMMAGQKQEAKEGDRWQLYAGEGMFVQPVIRTIFPSEQAALDFIPLAEVARKHRTYPYQEDGKTLWGIFRKMGDRKRTLVRGGFSTEEDAMRAMVADPVPIIEHKFAFPERPWLDNVERIGPARRAGDVTPTMFEQTFGFRGGEFGKWNMGGDGQQVLNHAYDGLLDLADALGVPPRALSLNGELAIAFGARGTGGKGFKEAGAAHYEEDYEVMNLTKMQGAGSLAHEWFHALDHYLSRMDGKASGAFENNLRGDRVRKVTTDPAGNNLSHGALRKSNLRPELLDAFKAVIASLNGTPKQVPVNPAHAEQSLKRYRESIDYRLADLRSSLTDGKYNRSKKVATPQQLAQWDALAAKLRAGELGEQQWIGPNGPIDPGAANSRVSSARPSRVTIVAMNAIYKAVTGRSFDKTGYDSIGHRLLQDVQASQLVAKDLATAIERAARGETNTVTRTSDYFTNAREIDQGRVSAYWSTPHEMGARAFESFIMDNIAERAGRSDYLVYGAENRYYALLGLKPYPEGDERRTINAAFTNLFKVIQTKDDGAGNVAMFSRRPPIGRQRMTVQDVENEALALTANWANAPRVVVVNSMNDSRVPKAVRDELARKRARDAEWTTDGFINGNTVYLVASELRTTTDVARVLFHESLGHYGLRGLYGAELDKILGQMAALMPDRVIAKAREYELGPTKRENLLRAAEEVLAEIAQSRPESTWVQRAIAAIRTWLRSNVPALAGLNLTDDELIRNYIVPARTFVERGRLDGMRAVPMFSRAPRWEDGGRQPNTPAEIRAAKAAMARIETAGGVTSPDDLRDLLRVSGYSQWAQSSVARDVGAVAALQADIAAEWPYYPNPEDPFEFGAFRPVLSSQGVLTFGMREATPERVAAIVRLAEKYGAPVAVRGRINAAPSTDGSGYRSVRAADYFTQERDLLQPLGFVPYDGMQELAGRDHSVLFSWIRPGGGITAATPLFSRRKPSGNAVLDEARRKAGNVGTAGLAEKIRNVWASGIQSLSSPGAFAREFRQGALDQFAGIQNAEQATLGNLPAEQSAYVTARLANGGTSSVMRAILLHGQPRWARNGQHLEAIPNTEGLLDILKPLGEDLNDWFDWMIGNRAERLMREGRENNFTPAEIAALQGVVAGNPAKLALFRSTSLKYAAFKKSILDVAQDAGLINAESRRVWDNADYIPFYREIDGRSIFSPTGRKGLAGQSSGIRVLKGGDSALNDPMENLLMNFSRLIDASLKNNAIRKTIHEVGVPGQLATKVGYAMSAELVPKNQVMQILVNAGTPQAILDVIPDDAFEGIAKMWALQAPTDPAVVRVMVDGKPEFYRVDEPYLLRALTSFVPFEFPGLGVMRAAKRVLTAAVTATPEFMIRNFIRDTLSTRMIASDGVGIGSAARGIWKSYTEGGAYEAMLFSGASFQSGNINAGTPEGTATAMRRALRDRGMSAASVDDFMQTVLDTPAKVWERYRHFGEAIENANREAVYEAAIKAGKTPTEAAYEAKDLMDFTLRGSWAGYQLLADVLPFFNARVQGLYRLGRADPKKVAMYGTALMVASVLLALANADDDRYNRLPDWDKDTYWHFFVGKHHWRIPKPFELGVVFGAIPERITRYLKGVDTGKKAAGRIGSSVVEQLAFDPVPQLFRPAVNVWANKDTFRDTPIENQRDEGLPAHMRYSATTSDTARILLAATAKATDKVELSPKKLEYLVGGYLGTAGLAALGLSDMVVRKLEGKPPGPEWRADDYPVVRVFYRVDPAKATVFESDLYDLRQAVNKVFKEVGTLKDPLKANDPARAQKVQRDNAELLSLRPTVENAANMLAGLNRKRDAIYADPKMTPAQKRAELDRIYAAKGDVAQKTMTAPAVKARQ